MTTEGEVHYEFNSQKLMFLYCSTNISNQDKWLAILVRIRNIPDSDTSSEIDETDGGFSCPSSIHPIKCRDIS
jgi:hypothetical protein